MAIKRSQIEKKKFIAHQGENVGEFYIGKYREIIVITRAYLFIYQLYL